MNFLRNKKIKWFSNKIRAMILLLVKILMTIHSNIKIDKNNNNPHNKIYNKVSMLN